MRDIPVIGVAYGLPNTLLYLSEGDLWCATESGVFTLLSVVGLSEAKSVNFLRRGTVNGQLWAKQFITAYAVDTVAALTDKVTWYTLLSNAKCGPGLLEAGIDPFLKRDEEGENVQIAFNDPKQNPWYWWAAGIYSNPVTALREGMSVSVKTADFMFGL